MHNLRCDECGEPFTVDIKRRCKDRLFRCPLCQNKRCKEHGRLQHNLKSRYGLSQEDYDRKLALQDHRCAICLNFPSLRKLSVDHDHKTGKVRDLLCTRCNAAIGHFDEDSGKMLAAIAYLEKHRVDNE